MSENEIKITEEAFEKFQEVRGNGGGLESYKTAGLSMGEIKVIACGYDLFKILHDEGMLEGTGITAELT